MSAGSSETGALEPVLLELQTGEGLFTCVPAQAVGLGSPVAGVTGCSELPDVGAGDQILILLKSCMLC